MTEISFLLWSISLGGLTLTLGAKLLQKQRGFLPLILLLMPFVVAPVLLVRFPLGRSPVPRGENDGEVWFLLALFVSMVLGMFAQHAFRRFSFPQGERPPFDLGLFLAPVFASPVVFIPLFAVIQAAGVDLYEADDVRIMLFLISFENGFFWKLIFDQRQLLNNKDTQ